MNQPSPPPRKLPFLTAAETTSARRRFPQRPSLHTEDYLRGDFAHRRLPQRVFLHTDDHLRGVSADRRLPQRGLLPKDSIHRGGLSKHTPITDAEGTFRSVRLDRDEIDPENSRR